MFSVTSYKASGVRGPEEPGRSQPRVSYRQLDTTIGHQRILQVPTKKKRTKETIAAITEATSYQSIAKECKIGQNIPGPTWRTHENNHVEGGQLPDSSGSPTLKWQGIVNVKTKQNTVIETQNMKIAISSETI